MLLLHWIAAAQAFAAPFKFPAKMPACDIWRLDADEARCEPEGCLLRGNAYVGCTTLSLSADKLSYTLDGTGHFGGATASGQVLVDDGWRSLQSDCITLGPDLTSMSMRQGLLRLRRTPSLGPPSDHAREPIGPFSLTVKGNLQRDAQGDIEASASTLTLCDCGRNALPSWQLYAAKVRVRQNARATIFWPRLEIVGLGRTMWPITPPLLPVSLPLVPRAFGLLAPRLAFLGGKTPTIDQPLFVPLGRSWDITVSPGLRTDWRNAPRLGLRLRGALSENHRLTAAVQMTFDYNHGAAARMRRIGPNFRYGPLDAAQFADVLAQTQALVWRGQVDLQHAWTTDVQKGAGPPRMTLAPQFDWQSVLHWVSDDGVLKEMAVEANQRLLTYLPSRSQLTSRHPHHVLQVGSDLMLRLDSVETGSDGLQRLVLSNTHGVEMETLHKLPWAKSQFFFKPWARQVRPIIELDAARYHAFGSRNKDQVGGATHSQSQARLAVGLHWGRMLGPMRTQASASVDAMVAQAGAMTYGPRHLVDPLLVVDGSLVLPLWRAFGASEHIIWPRLRYRAVWRRDALPLEDFAAQHGVLSPYLERGAVHQMSLGFGQKLMAGAFVGRLDLSLPWDLLRARPGQLQGRLVTTWGGYLHSDTVVSAGLSSTELGVQHLSQHVEVGTKDLGVAAVYLRATPYAERFARTVYELSGDARALRAFHLPGQSAHTLRVTAHKSYNFGLSVRYGMVLALLRPSVNTAQKGPQDASLHSLGLGYSSPCRCWSVALGVSAAPQRFWQTVRAQATFSLAPWPKAQVF